MKTTLGKRVLATSCLLIVVAAIATVSLNLAGCSIAKQVAQNVPGGAQFAPLVTVGEGLALDERTEKAMGESVSLALTNRYHTVKDDVIARYVVLVGKTVAKATPRADKPWLFGVLDTDKVNAYSGPQGYVWVTRGALMQMKDESELAGVLGHEMGHIVDQHGLAAVRTGKFAQAGQEALQANNQTSQFNFATNFLVKLITENGFSQAQEFEADRESAKYVASAGYDPNGFVNFLDRLQKQQGSGQGFFSTHPGMADRVQRLRQQISSAGTGGHGATLGDRFQRYVKTSGSTASIQ